LTTESHGGLENRRTSIS